MAFNTHVEYTVHVYEYRDSLIINVSGHQGRTQSDPHQPQVSVLLIFRPVVSYSECGCTCTISIHMVNKIILYTVCHCMGSIIQQFHSVCIRRFLVQYDTCTDTVHVQCFKAREQIF